MADTPAVVELKRLLEKHNEWNNLLLDSITEAKEDAFRQGLKIAKTLPDRLEGKNGYFNFLNRMVEWIPHKNISAEVLNKLCSFYWLLNPSAGQRLQKSKAFNKWMIKFVNEWGYFLNTSKSSKGISTFVEDPAFQSWQYMESPSGWLTFNQFFAREIKPGLRPVAGMGYPGIITSPADSTFKSKFPITESNEVIVKYTHKYKILDLLDGSPYQERFINGLFWHSVLGPYDYHRLHSPVSGTVVEVRSIQQNIHLNIKIKNGKFVTSNGSGYEFKQTRGIIVFDSPIGLVAVIPVGMSQVSSVNITAVKDSYLKKGDEFGYFMFGGSDIIMLFENQSNVVISSSPGIHYNYGMCVGEVPDV